MYFLWIGLIIISVPTSKIRREKFSLLIRSCVKLHFGTPTSNHLKKETLCFSSVLLLGRFSSVLLIHTSNLLSIESYKTQVFSLWLANERLPPYLNNGHLTQGGDKFFIFVYAKHDISVITFAPGSSQNHQRSNHNSWEVPKLVCWFWSFNTQAYHTRVILANSLIKFKKSLVQDSYLIGQDEN